MHSENHMQLSNAEFLALPFSLELVSLQLLTSPWPRWVLSHEAPCVATEEEDVLCCRRDKPPVYASYPKESLNMHRNDGPVILNIVRVHVASFNDDQLV